METIELNTCNEVEDYIDNSFLQIFGPYGIIRYFFFLSFNLNKFNLAIFFNYICFMSFFFLFFLIF